MPSASSVLMQGEKKKKRHFSGMFWLMHLDGYGVRGREQK
jgi:hypothetical protein